MGNQYRDQDITQEIEIPTEHWEPLEYEGSKIIKFNLSNEQTWFIEEVAKEFNLTYSAAFAKIWGDSFHLLMDVRHKITDYKHIKSKTWG